jgi:hypothetical protein
MLQGYLGIGFQKGMVPSFTKGPASKKGASTSRGDVVMRLPNVKVILGFRGFFEQNWRLDTN